jgi:hypothetical protein
MTADSTKVFPPLPKALLLPPEPVPDYLRGRHLVIRVRVNEKGKPDLAATVFRGPIRSPYLERFADVVRRWEFAPAVLDGCEVPGSTEIAIDLHR